MLIKLWNPLVPSNYNNSLVWTSWHLVLEVGENSMYPLICINWNKVGGGGYFPWNKILVAIHIAKRTSNFKNKLKHNFHFF